MAIGVLTERGINNFMHTIPIFSEDKNTVKGNLIPDLKEVEKHF